MSIAVPFLGEFGNGLLLISMFLLVWLYNVLFEVLNHGATPGKRVIGLKVMNINGTPVGWSSSMIRNLLRFIDSLPGCYAFGCIAVLISKHFQRLGDLAAGTIVVHHPKANAAPKANDAKPIPVTVPLSLDEQQAIVSFGERAASLSSERAEELATCLDPIFSDVSAETLRGHANWLAGGGRSS